MKRLRSALGVLALGVLTMGGMIVLSSIPASIPASAAAPPPQAAPTQAQEEGPPPGPEAKLQEEFAAYQQFMQEQGPDEQIRMVEDFLLEYPQSELKEYAFQVATQAYQPTRSSGTIVAGSFLGFAVMYSLL